MDPLDLYYNFDADSTELSDRQLRTEELLRSLVRGY